MIAAVQVLDIAGGKGAVAYALHCENAVPTTLIDPGKRKNQLTSRQRRALKKTAGTSFKTLPCYFDASFTGVLLLLLLLLPLPLLRLRLRYVSVGWKTAHLLIEHVVATVIRLIFAGFERIH